MAVKNRGSEDNAPLNLGILCQGQGTQKPGMFKQLLGAQSSHVRQAAGEVLEGMLKKANPEVFGIYYGDGVESRIINSTVNVQPATAAATMVWHRALESIVGHEIVPDVASGYSFGAVVAAHLLGVLSAEDLLNISSLRGKVFAPIEPGQYCVITLYTNEPARIKTLNKWHLKGTAYRVTIVNAPTIVSIAGELERPNGNAESPELELDLAKTEARIPETLRERLKDLEWKGLVRKIAYLHGGIYYVPFHQRDNLKDVAAFFKSQLMKYCERESRTRDEHVFLEPQGALITNSGRRLTSGTAVMRYLASEHIMGVCNFARTMEVVGNHASTVIGLGDLSFQKSVSEKEGYITNFVVVKNESGLETAARAYESVLEQRAKADFVAEPVRGLTQRGAGRPQAEPA